MQTNQLRGPTSDVSTSGYNQCRSETCDSRYEVLPWSHGGFSLHSSRPNILSAMTTLGRRHRTVYTADQCLRCVLRFAQQRPDRCQCRTSPRGITTLSVLFHRIFRERIILACPEQPPQHRGSGPKRLPRIVGLIVDLGGSHSAGALALRFADSQRADSTGEDWAWSFLTERAVR